MQKLNSFQTIKNQFNQKLLLNFKEIELFQQEYMQKTLEWEIPSCDAF